MVTAGLISGGASLLGGLFGASSAKRRQRAAAKEKKRLEAKLTNLENNRQAVVNPYETVKDLSGMISNPYENLGVATQAARNQADQAALQSKKGVSASIEQQEAQNEKLRAQGELAETKARMAEAQRIQTAEAAGKQFVFGAQENRENAQLDRISAQLSGAEAREAQAASDRVGAITSAVGSIANIAGSYMGGKAQIGAAIAGKTGKNPYI
jgi:hypothetical protein